MENGQMHGQGMYRYADTTHLNSTTHAPFQHLNKLLGDPTEEETTDALSRALATLSARHGGLGLRSAARIIHGIELLLVTLKRRTAPSLKDFGINCIGEA